MELQVAAGRLCSSNANRVAHEASSARAVPGELRARRYGALRSSRPDKRVPLCTATTLSVRAGEWITVEPAE